MAIDVLTLSLAKSYTKKSLLGLGALKGANCTVKSIVDTSTGSTVTFEWTATDGSTQTSRLNIKDGVDGSNGKDGSSITNIEVRQVGTEYHLICTITDSDGSENEIDAGILPSSHVDIATTDKAGIVKVGKNLEIDADGVLSAIGGNIVTEISKLNYDLLTPDQRKDKVYYIYDDDENKGQTLEYSDQRPTTTNANMGDIVFNSLPEPAGFVGWVYTAFGWLGFGTIESTRTVQFILNDNTPFMVDDRTGTGNGTPFLYKDSII